MESLTREISSGIFREKKSSSFVFILFNFYLGPMIYNTVHNNASVVHYFNSTHSSPYNVSKGLLPLITYPPLANLVSGTVTLGEKVLLEVNVWRELHKQETKENKMAVFASPVTHNRLQSSASFNSTVWWWHRGVWYLGHIYNLNVGSLVPALSS